MSTDHVMRRVRADEWPAVKELRLLALQDPAAPVAFLETYESAVEEPDSFWQQRTARGAEGSDVAQFVAEAADGRWMGSVTVLVERPDREAVFGGTVEATQGHLVGVFVRPEVRGTGVADALFRAAEEWAFGLEDPYLARLRLFVHENNPRAAAFYRRYGFVPTGNTVPVPGNSGEREVEHVRERG
ncbi:GNAT family N-acetyltransferase [Streptomyces sp. NBC_00102]|uniref:GNAT family N-acetyltransferase n=1 Tax=Streptomyces sp. NBC_00102 TaxID=2975652 RepID=UPI00225835FA|nr:GNAT family N-acetyltransferase [Streptomyces sp. NBC_00102]MCX5398037.1 GNAT family N-acetyltransferase [Streptomyces sp. NBC_00102]